jgi:hypothetical protein
MRLATLLLLAVIATAQTAHAAADMILGVDSTTGVPQALTSEEAGALINAGTSLPDTTIVTSEAAPLKVYGTGGQAANGWNIGQGSDGQPFMTGICGGVVNGCDYYRQFAAGKKGGFKDSGGNIDFEYEESTGRISIMSWDVEAPGNNLFLPFRWDLDMAAVSPTDGTTVSHIWNEDPLSSTPTPTAAVGTNRGTAWLNFPDSDGAYGVQITRAIPDGTLTGNFDADIWWNTTGTGNARFQIQTKCYADDEADDAAFNTVSIVTAAAGTSGRPNKQTITGITVTGCAGGELMRIRFFRDRTEGSDSLTAALNVEKIVFKGRVIE